MTSLMMILRAASETVSSLVPEFTRNMTMGTIIISH